MAKDRKSVTVNESNEKGRMPYDNREVKEGEVLVPMMATPERIEGLDVDKRNLRTWRGAGRLYTVMFYPVPKEFRNEAMRQFNAELNEYLGKNRDARCLIPQEDGTVKVCPKKNGDNHCACKDCPYNGVLERQDKTEVSLEALMEESEYEPATSPSAEEEYMLAAMLEELLEELNEKYPKEAEIVNMLLDDVDKEAIFERLGLKKSQGYNLIKSAEKHVRKFIYDL